MPLINKKNSAVSVGTINRKGAILRRIANLAYKEWHWIDRPIYIRLLPESIRKRSEIIDKKTLIKLAKTIPEPEAAALVRILFFSGMRFSEVQRVIVDGEYFDLQESKNGKPRRIKINDEIKEDVKLLPLKRGYQWYREKFAEAAVGVGRPNLHMHDLRHSIASHLLVVKKTPIKVVSDLLGHSSIKVTADIYGHVYNEQMDDAVDSI